MAQPLPSRKSAVDLAAPAKVGSRIRRDPPPPPPRKVTAQEIREREATVVVIGIAVFALALVIVMVAATRWAGWSPSQYTVRYSSSS